jgi:aquaporin Z
VKSRTLLAEGLGTALLVFFGVGTATLSFGFGFHTSGTSTAAGVVLTALAFGLVLMALVYSIGPVSGCHVNPAVTIGFLVAGRIGLIEAVGYWVAQLVGGIAGAAALYGILHSSPLYNSHTGLGANGYGASSMIGASAWGAFLAEVILTALFVFVILAVTRTVSNATVAGLAIGLTLTLVHVVGIPIDGTSVNPARSLAAAIFAGGGALGQVWVFIVAPLVGGAIAALLSEFAFPLRDAGAAAEGGAEGTVPAQREAEPAPEPAPELSVDGSAAAVSRGEPRGEPRDTGGH